MPSTRGWGEFPAVEFERFADDAVVHCATGRQALQVRAALSERLASVGLRLHPDKTKVVYCKECVTNAEGGVM
jgi:RNA-directed DNA polymerase